MRQSGNEHEVSWNASYEVIKRQSSGLFKTSPTHAAVMITEAVVKNPNEFDGCGSYLGDLFSPHIKKLENETNNEESLIQEEQKDRYRY